MNPLGYLLDPFKRTADSAEERFRFTPSLTTWAVPLGIGVSLLLVSFALGLGGEDGHLFSQRFFFSYVTAYAFCLTITLGALFFVMVQHITQATWSIVVRRIAEIVMMSFPILAILLIPIILGMHDLYHWTHTELYEVGGAEFDPILDGKSAYLNSTFFILRWVFYFAVWIFFSYKLYSLSLKQDLNPNENYSKRLKKITAFGLPLFVLTLAFGGIDLIMTLDPHWFSTMFGVYIFAGAFFSINAMITLIALLYHKAGYLKGIITNEHYHDLGKFMFAFTVFWAYIAFSQYMLIWFANLPEETVWFRHRIEGSWGSISLVLLFGHFIIPFLIMIFRASKRFKPVLWVMVFWFLAMHFVDMYWLIMPVIDTHGFHPQLIDFTMWLGMAFMLFGLGIARAGRHSLVPHNDPRFTRSVDFENQ